MDKQEKRFVTSNVFWIYFFIGLIVAPITSGYWWVWDLFLAVILHPNHQIAWFTIMGVELGYKIRALK